MAKYKIIPSSRTIVQSPISIGHKAEKGVEAIEFDLTAWVETYGSGTLTVIMRRWGDAIPYPIALEIGEDNKATWTLSDIDTAKAGMAYAQLSYVVGDEVVKKSDIYTFRVMDSLTGEGEPPEAYESWLEHLTHLAAEAMAEVLDIEGIVTDKTLTVNGGIADGKATGDALALKADKSTTYTKTEVDQMIEDVEVETDTTLTISGAPADAKKTGDALSALEDQFSEETDKLKDDLDTISLGIDDGDGKVYIYVNGVKQGDGIEISSGSISYDVTVNAKGRVSTQSASGSVERGGNVSIEYDIPSGWILNASATIRGNAIEVPSGNPMVFTNVTGPLEVNLNAKKPYSTLADIPSYYGTPIADALTYIDSLGNGWTNYIITTDHHVGMLNKLHSADIVSYLLSTGKFDKSIILGDLVDGGYIDGENYTLALSIGWDGHNDKTLIVKGNHDDNLDVVKLMDDFMSGVQNVVVDPASNWWYYDNVDAGIRFIGLQYGTTNYAFFEQAISTLPTGWIYFVLNHIPLSSYPAGKSWTVDDTAIQNVLINHTDKILAGFLVGHLHSDACVQFEWLAWHTMFNCDKMDNTHTEAARVEGTVKEHAVTLMSVNKTTSKVKFYRIGSVLWRSGQSGSWTYTADTPSQWEYTYEPLHFARSDETEWTDGLAYSLNLTAGQRLTNHYDGVTENNANWYISDYMYCEGANCITVNSGAYIERNCFYDANKDPLGVEPTRTKITSNLYVISVPAGASYWRTSMVDSGYTSYKAIPYENPYSQA